MSQNTIDPNEVYRATCAVQLEEYKARMSFVNESNKGTMQFAGWVLKAIFLANGAAAITCLTFIGTPQRVGGLDPANVGQAVECFAYGVVASVATAMLAYVAQYFITEASQAAPMSYTKVDPEKPLTRRVLTLPRFALFVHALAVAAAAISLGLFIWGMFVAAGK